MIHVTIVAWMLAVAAGGAATQEGPRTPVPAMKLTTVDFWKAVSPAERPREYVSLVWSGGRWLIWTISGPPVSDVPWFCRYYRQDLYRPETTLVDDGKKYRGQLAGVLEDGTVLFFRDHELTWITPEGTTIDDRLEIPGNEFKIIQGFADGVLCQVIERPATTGHVYFAPIAQRKIDLGKKVHIGNDALPISPSPRFLRHGSLLARDNWVFDLRYQAQRRFEPAPNMRWVTATPFALDGQTLILCTYTTSSGNVAVSLADGKVMPIEYRTPSGTEQSVRFLAVRNRIGYFSDGYFLDLTEKKGKRVASSAWHLLAKDLSTPDGKTRELVSFPGYLKERLTRRYLIDLPHILADEGLVIWNGEKWQTVPWLKSIDGEPTRGVLQQQQRSLGDAVIRVTALQIRETRTFARISSHFVGTPLADKPGFLYAGTDTAAAPVTDEPRTIFWVYSDKRPPGAAFQPDKATLKTQSGQIVSCITDDTIYASCQPYVFSKWREEHNTISGFIVFPLVKNLDGELWLPYAQRGKLEELRFRFGSTEEDIDGLRKTAGSVGLDLAKHSYWKTDQPWIDKKVSDVLLSERIAQVILTKARTSAPGEIDIINVLRRLKPDAVFDRGPETWEPDRAIWEAVILTDDHRTFLFRVNGEWACLTSKDGHGFLRMKR